MAAEAAGEEAAAAPAGKKLNILDLPLETQREVIAHCSQTELICAALVSKHFHELASSQLYRNFNIIFPDDDDIHFDSPIDGLAGGLDTFTTSDYNYTQHLRELSMDTLSAGVKGELSYQSYLYSASCGKFLNTLLHLTLKKAKSLELFKWNIRVELSRQVYRELHRIPSLKKLHLRMQVGESYYVPPPPLPVTGDFHMPDHAANWAGVPTPLPSQPPGMTSTISLPLTANPPPILEPPSSLVPPSKSLPKSKLSKRDLPVRDPPTLSGFRNLQSLAVLDIDDLDIVPELKACVKNSASTLHSLQLSLSDHLALQARKPAPDSDPDDSDVDDDFQGMPPSNHHNDGTGPAKAFRAQEEKSVQEGLLGRVFDVELQHLPEAKAEAEVEAPAQSPSLEQEPTTKLTSRSNQNADEQFIESIRSVSDQLMTVVHGTRDRSSAHQDILGMIEKAAKKYVESSAPSNKHDGGATEGETSASGANHSQSPSNADDPSPPGHAVASSPAVEPQSMSNHDAALEAIDIEHVELTNDTADESDEQVPEISPGDNHSVVNNAESASENHSNLFMVSQPNANQSNHSNAAHGSLFGSVEEPEQDSRLVDNVHFLQDRIIQLKDQIHSVRTGGSTTGFQSQHQEITKLEKKIQHMEETITEIRTQIDAYSKSKAKAVTPESSAKSSNGCHQRLADYMKETRGFALETLSIHLIPVKASVLSRAVDLRHLRQLTLLNVGAQAPIWTLLSKENKVKPLPLREVYTDNVSDAFLSCMSQLEELHELFMLERSVKSKPESFAPRSTNTMDQIRRVVLAKHMPTLKRLMIKDESSSPNWDANEKAMIYICTRGKELQELAISLNISAVHAFSQYLPGLSNLRALHILHFRNNDTCIWVMREILRFIVDNLSHHPESKLEWIAMEDDRVDHIVRPSPAEEKFRREQRRKKQASKGKAPDIAGAHGAYPTLPSLPLGSDSESDSDDDIFDHGTRLRLKTSGPMQFYDVWGVKIFEKEIRSGRL